MAHYGLSCKVGSAGKGSPHAQYQERLGKYAKYADDLVSSEAGNLPSWSKSAVDFFKSADEYERANGTAYREYILDLPRELTPEENEKLAKRFINETGIGSRHVWSMAIHSPTATDGDKNPHAHIMFSERELDNIERPEKQFFKRYNAKTPERGGARKARDWKPRLEEIREKWADIQNREFERAGLDVRVSHLSNEARGLPKPEPRLLPSEKRRMKDTTRDTSRDSAHIRAVTEIREERGIRNTWNQIRGSQAGDKWMKQVREQMASMVRQHKEQTEQQEQNQNHDRGAPSL